MIQLYDHQKKIIEEIRALMRAGHKKILTVAPCGSGKTILASYMVKAAAEKNIPSLFLCHRRELLSQTIRAFGDVGVRHGVIANGFMEDRRHNIQVASVQTISRRLKKIKPPKFIIFDETHHICAKSWANIYHSFPDAFFVGLTATPQRTDQAGLGKFFDRMVLGPSTKWLIDNKFLSAYKLFAPSSVDVSSLHVRMGDYAQDELSKVMDKPTVVGNAITHYKKLSFGKRAIVRAVSIEHSKNVASQFRDAGIPALHVDGDTPTDLRDKAIKDFQSGKIIVLSQVDLFGEGLDIKSVECVIDLRPTKSLILWIQFCGRALRVCEGKHHAVILDHANNCRTHGLPDEERQWSLEGHEGQGKKGEKQTTVRICGSCFAAQPSGKPVCQFCGFVFEKKPRKVEEQDGELTEVDIEKLRKIKRMEQGKCETLQDLVELGKKRKYRRPYLWAKYLWNARQRRKVGLVGV